MPLPSSGEIKVSQVNVELGRASNAPDTRFANGTIPQTGTLFKLGEAGTGVNQTAPHALSEFYDYSIITTGLSGCLLTRTGQYTTNSYEDITYDVSSYAGMRVRFVWHYVSGSSFTGDIQIDNFSLELSYNSTQYYSQNFNGLAFISGEEFQTSSADTSAYTSVSFSNLAVGGTALKWNLDSGGTSSGSTGLTTDGDGTSSQYVYAEVSSPGYPNKNFWLRSFEMTLPEIQSEVKFKMARYGATIGTICLHIDVLDIKPPYFVHQSGAYNISDNQGNYHDDCGGILVDDVITFTDATYGDGNSASSIWKVDLPLDEMQLGLNTFSYIQVDHADSGDPGIDSVKLFSADSVSGPWTLKDTGTYSVNNYRVFFSINNVAPPKYIKIEIEKQDGSENTLYPMNLSLARTINECA